MYKLVQQKEDSDCLIACVAMMAKVDYYKAFNIHGDTHGVYHGISSLEAIRILDKLGIEARREFGIIPVPSIVFVPSINKAATMHAVFWDGEDILFDPQSGRSGRLAYNLELMLKGHSYSIIDAQYYPKEKKDGKSC